MRYNIGVLRAIIVYSTHFPSERSILNPRCVGIPQIFTPWYWSSVTRLVARWELIEAPKSLVFHLDFGWLPLLYKVLNSGTCTGFCTRTGTFNYLKSPDH